MGLPIFQDKPLLPFEEWNIDFSELTVGPRVGIGKNHTAILIKYSMLYHRQIRKLGGSHKLLLSLHETLLYSLNLVLFAIEFFLVLRGVNEKMEMGDQKGIQFDYWKFG